MDFISIFLYFMEVFFIASNKNNQPINEQIKASHVLVIGPNGEQVGVKPIQDALTLANYAGLDLVMLNPNQDPPVCKVMDYNKYRYEKQKKEKEALKKQKANSSELKEFRLSPVIDVGDFDTKYQGQPRLQGRCVRGGQRGTLSDSAGRRGGGARLYRGGAGAFGPAGRPHGGADSENRSGVYRQVSMADRICRDGGAGVRSPDSFFKGD